MTILTIPCIKNLNFTHYMSVPPPPPPSPRPASNSLNGKHEFKILIDGSISSLYVQLVFINSRSQEDDFVNIKCVKTSTIWLFLSRFRAPTMEVCDKTLSCTCLLSYIAHSFHRKHEVMIQGLQRTWLLPCVSPCPTNLLPEPELHAPERMTR